MDVSDIQVSPTCGNVDNTRITRTVGNGKVILIAGGGKIYTDLAARFVRSERSIVDIVGSAYDKNIVSNIINSGHRAATEFDYFIFGVEGYSRVCETQLVRKRLASYLIKSGRAELNGKRTYDVTLPEAAQDHQITIDVPANVHKRTLLGNPVKVEGMAELTVNAEFINMLTEAWYNQGVDKGIAEEDLRYMKPQATTFKAIIGMNAHALLDWFQIRCCLNAQREIRHMATKMLQLCREAAPDLFANAGPSCVHYGYCPEDQYQNAQCKRIGKYLPKSKALEVLLTARS